jgi:hypothetical protein
LSAFKLGECGYSEVEIRLRNGGRNRQAGVSERGYCWPIGKARRFLRSVGGGVCIISPRPGREPTITLGAKAWLVSLACPKAKDLGLRNASWVGARWLFQEALAYLAKPLQIFALGP